VKESTQQLNEQLSPHWKKFFNHFNDIDNLPVKNWNVPHLIGWWAKKYEQHYKIVYTFTFNGPPSKSSEVKLMGRLANMLTKDPVILKDYIDWFFEKEIINKKRRINSIAALAQLQPINNYKFKKLLVDNKGSIDRATIIPPHYIVILENNGVKITTYGELAFAKKDVDAGNTTYNKVINELQATGMDISVLDKVK
jgi:hypothetical protein